MVLQHLAVAEDQQNVCRIAQVCKTWRTAVQHSEACLTDIMCSLLLPCNPEAHAAAIADFADKLAQFAQWITRYAGTVRSIQVDIPGVMAESPAIRSLIKLAHSVLGLGLKAAAGTQVLPVSSSQATAAQAAGSVAAMPLQLRSFSCSNFLAKPLVLSALPAATLTLLEFREPDLAGQLSMGHPQVATGNPDSWDTKEVGLMTIDLVHLTALQQLIVHASAGLTALRLPQQLIALDLEYGDDTEPPLSFASPHLQLQQLTISNSKDTAEGLLQLKQLQQLTKLELNYADMDYVLEAAPAWPQLAGQLVALELSCSEKDTGEVLCSVYEVSKTMQALSLLTSLTRLELICLLEDPNSEDLEDVEAVSCVTGICQRLKPLTNLQALRLDLDCWLDLQDHDILHLSALTSLTQLSLYLYEQSRALESSNMSAVLHKLSRLQHLSLSQLQDVDPLQVVGTLRQLTYLQLHGLPQDVQQQGLRYLTGLHRLQELRGFESCSDEMLQQFWADVRC